MKVKINSKNVDVKENITVLDIKEIYKKNADLVIINGFPATKDTIIKENDEIVLIKKGETPTEDDFEYMLTSRHTPKVHEKLKKSSVAIAGLGGLGSNCAISLARMGIGRLKIIDFDVVEPSNLNRQQYFISQIGMKKVDALNDIIKMVNPFVNVELSYNFIEKDNIKEIFNGFDVILECFDNRDTKAMFVSEVIKTFPNSFLVAVSGIAGIYSHTLFTMKKLGKSCIILGDFTNEATFGEGLMATRAAIAANIQANIAVRHILGESNE